MKRDPFQRPINLGKPPAGGWKFKDPTGYVLVDTNFWRLAKMIVSYRQQNRITGTDFESVQLEVLKQLRTDAGLPLDLATVEPGASKESPVQLFVKKRYKGCRSCGGRR